MVVDQLLQAALADQRDGSLEAAAANFRAVLEMQPEHVAALHGLGAVCLQRNADLEAYQLLQRAAGLQPDAPRIAFTLGLAEARLGQTAQAAERLQRAGIFAADDPELLLQVCRKLLSMRAYGQLVAVVAAAGAGEPAVLRLGAQAQAQFGNWAAAVSWLKLVVETRPQASLPHRELATALARQREFSEALVAFEGYLALTADNALDRLAYADLLLMARRPAESAIAAQRALDLGADMIDAEFILAKCDRLRGDHDAARRRLRRVTAKRPGLGNAWWLLLDLEDDRASLQAIATACAGLAREAGAALAGEAGADAANAVLLALTAGRAHERLECYDTAFAEFRFGNAVQRARLAEQGAEYDPAATESFGRRSMELFGERLPATASPPRSPTPIFVVGLPRSGTTLVERLLASVDGVEAGGECEALEFVASQYYWEFEHGRLPAPSALGDAERTRLVAEYWRRTGAAPRPFTDKLPHNFRHIGLIGLLFPHAPIIYLRRDPRDVAVSIFSRPFPDGHAYACDLAAIAHFHNQAERLLTHWRQVMPGRILEVDYQALVRDPPGRARQITDFCGLPWDPGCLEFHTRTDASFTFSEMQVRQAINDHGVGRWRHYQRHLGPLLAALEQAPQ